MERTQNVAQALFPTGNAPAPSPAGLFDHGASPFAAPSPFAPRPQSHEVAADAPEGSYTYALVKSAPDVPAGECEVPVASVEITIFWGATILHLAHLTPPRSFYVGESDCDYCLPAEKTGTARMPVLLVSPGAKPRAVIASHAKGTIDFGGECMTVAEAIESRKARPCPDVPGAHEIELDSGSTARIDMDGIVFQIAPVHAGRVAAGKAAVDGRGLSFQGLSAALHLGMLAAAALLMPPLGSDNDSAMSADQAYYMQQMIQATAEPEIDTAKTLADPGAAELAPTLGDPTKTNPDKPGTTGGVTNPSPVAAANPSNPAGAPMDREDLLAVASKFGIIDLLNASPQVAPGASPVPWGNVAVSDPPRSVLTNLWIGGPNGPGGLDLTSIGVWGGPGGGIKAGPIGTIDGGKGDPNGIPRRPFVYGKHDATGPGMTPHPLPSSEGTLAPDLIQRTVRQNFGRFRMCYQNGLRANPGLAGRVSVRFVIGRDGSVSSAGNGGSDLPDANVVSCVVRAFYGVSFPAPQNGIVRVTYPIVFSPT